jgi:hypothetical protein
MDIMSRNTITVTVVLIRSSFLCFPHEVLEMASVLNDIQTRVCVKKHASVPKFCMYCLYHLHVVEFDAKVHLWYLLQ